MWRLLAILVYSIHCAPYCGLPDVNQAVTLEIVAELSKELSVEATNWFNISKNIPRFTKDSLFNIVVISTAENLREEEKVRYIADILRNALGADSADNTMYFITIHEILKFRYFAGMMKELKLIPHRDLPDIFMLPFNDEVRWYAASNEAKHKFILNIMKEKICK